jgi:hypothetical protein
MTPATYGVVEFSASLADIAGQVLLYIGGGITAGLVIMALMWGVRKGLQAARTVSS